MRFSKFLQYTTLGALTSLAFGFVFFLTQSAPPKPLPIKVNKFKKHKGPGPSYVKDLVDASFSNAVWGDKNNYLEGYKTRLWEGIDISSQCSEKGRCPKNLNWYDKYMFYYGDFPQHNTINKWTDKVTIGVGWPKDKDGKTLPIPGLVRIDDPVSIHTYKYLPEDTERFYKAVEPHIKDLQQLTGLPVELYKSNDPRERSEEFARIRIIPLSGKPPTQNYFKFDFVGHPGFGCAPERCSGISAPSHFSEKLLPLPGIGKSSVYAINRFPAAVPFTFETPEQAYGFLLPEADNSLGVAVCIVSTEVGDELISSLISECLLRSMGLPSIVKNKRDILLGNWNASHREHSKSTVQNGKYAGWGWRKSTDTKFPHQLTNKDKLFSHFTNYDKDLLEGLYCKDIKPGMDKYAFIYTFQTKRCALTLKWFSKSTH